MKFLTLLAALTGVALAQDPAPEKPQDPAPAKPAGESPAPEKAPEKAPDAAEAPKPPADTKPDLKPTSPDTKPVGSNLKPTPADLPELPAPSDNPDMTKGQPGGRLKPGGEPQLLPDEVPTNRKTNPGPPIPGSAFERGKTRTSIKPPTTSVDLDLRIRYRQAQSKAAADPAIQAFWEESRLAVTDYAKREAMKSYYQRLFKKMLAIDKGIAPLVEDRQRYALRRLEQTRIDPTDPLDEDFRVRRE